MRPASFDLRQDLLKRGWRQSPIDECLFVKQGLILILYVDDACLTSHSKLKIQQEIVSLKQDYDLTDDEELQDYIGNRFQRHTDDSVTLSQPRMIERLLAIVGLDTKVVKSSCMTHLQILSSKIMQVLNQENKIGIIDLQWDVYLIFKQSYIRISPSLYINVQDSVTTQVGIMKKL